LRAQEFLGRKNIQAKATTNAKHTALGEDDALELASEAEEIYVSKGAKTVYLDLKKQRPSAQALASLMLGPTGNLRAPTLRIRKTLLIGFDEAMYAKVLKN
jgi:arsenate reductase-like glutaredoxin family protein